VINDRPPQEDEDWSRVVVKEIGPTNLEELQARAPAKRKKIDPFAKVKLKPAAQAFKALNCQKAMVWVWLVHRSWKRQSPTVSVPNEALRAYGVSREVKRRALKDLEAAGLIEVDYRPYKNPVVTLL
jgi:hypothetical protein